MRSAASRVCRTSASTREPSSSVVVTLSPGTVASARSSASSSTACAARAHRGVRGDRERTGREVRRHHGHDLQRQPAGARLPGGVHDGGASSVRAVRGGDDVVGAADSWSWFLPSSGLGLGSGPGCGAFWSLVQHTARRAPRAGSFGHRGLPLVPTWPGPPGRGTSGRPSGSTGGAASCHHATVTSPPNDLAVTWWGHATATVEIGGIRVATDPVLVDRLFHLRRYGVTPRPEAGTADLILLSHLHGDHIHLRSLRRFGPTVPVVAPHGARRLLRRLGLEDVRTVSPGDLVDVARCHHRGTARDARRPPLAALPAARPRPRLPGGGGRPLLLVPRRHRVFATTWPRYAGSTWPWSRSAAGARPWVRSTWTPTREPRPSAGSGARWAVPVHWGTFWPVALSRITPARHTTLFVTPGPRFADALRATAPDVVTAGAPARRADRPRLTAPFHPAGVSPAPAALATVGAPDVR